MKQHKLPKLSVYYSEEVQGLVISTLEYLKNKEDNRFNKNYVIPTENIFAPISKYKQFYHCLNNDFVNSKAKKALEISDEAFEIKKNEFLKSADARLILFGMDFKDKNPNEDFYIITGETSAPNDKKIFHKIPRICKTPVVNIEAKTIPQYLSELSGIKCKFKS